MHFARPTVFSCLFLIPSLGAGCASVTFHSDGRVGRDEGFLFYPPKTYLVIEPVDKGEKATVVVLPDLHNAMRVKQNPGWGATSFNFSTVNGVITGFNATNDSKAAETLTGLLSGAGGILTGAGSLAAASAAASGAEATAEGAVLSAIVSAILGGGGDGFAAGHYEIGELVESGRTINDASRILEDLKFDPMLETIAVLKLIANDTIDAAKLNIQVKGTKVDDKTIAEIVESYGAEREKLRAKSKALVRRIDAQLVRIMEFKKDLRGERLDKIEIVLMKLDASRKTIVKFAAEPESAGTGVRVYEIVKGSNGSLNFVRQAMN